MKLDFNQEWRVYPTPEPEEWNRPRTYEIVNLPHDYNISLETQRKEPPARPVATILAVR